MFYDFVKAMGSILDDLIYKRGEYQENCTRFLKATFPTGTGEWNQLKCVDIDIFLYTNTHIQIILSLVQITL